MPDDIRLPMVIAGHDSTGAVQPVRLNTDGSLAIAPAEMQAVTQNGEWTVGLIAGTAVSINNLPVTQAVTGAIAVNNFPATQPISGSVSVGNFPATQAVTVGNFPATQTVGGSVSVSNLPATQPISGAVAVNNFPAAQAVTQSGTWAISIANQPAVQAVSGAVTVSNFPSVQAVREPSMRSVGAIGLAGSVGIIMTATTAGGVILTFADGSTMPVYVPIGTTMMRVVPTSAVAGVVGTLLAAVLSAVKSYSES